jgi:pseudomonalisin
VIPTSTGLAATNLRGLPDIAMAADAFSGAYNIYGPDVPGVGDCIAGCAIGRTSEASPLAMGAYARLMSAHRNVLGFAAPLFYANFLDKQSSAVTVTGPPPTQALGGFHDVITGANGPYTALPGYHYTTGLGSIDVTVMNGLIGNYPGYSP